jgi:hypothetical protein
MYAKIENSMKLKKKVKKFTAIKGLIVPFIRTRGRGYIITRGSFIHDRSSQKAKKVFLRFFLKGFKYN